MYVYRKTKTHFSIIPKGLYVNAAFFHTIPSGFKTFWAYAFYKHTFPSGIGHKLKMGLNR
jgi:hypothetical protein